jgi:hypothetical protein
LLNFFFGSSQPSSVAQGASSPPIGSSVIPPSNNSDQAAMLNQGRWNAMEVATGSYSADQLQTLDSVFAAIDVADQSLGTDQDITDQVLAPSGAS